MKTCENFHFFRPSNVDGVPCCLWRSSSKKTAPVEEEAATQEEAAPTEESAPAEEAAAPTEEAAAPAEEEAMEGEGSYLERAKAGEFAGTTVEVLGVMVEEDGLKMEESLKPFIEATGIDVQYIGTKEFETQLNVRVDAGDAPDIADMPQPGLLANLTREGYVVDVSTFLSEEQVIRNLYSQLSGNGDDGRTGWTDYGRCVASRSTEELCLVSESKI